MRKCSNCGKVFKQNVKFCDECGSLTEGISRFCENCGSEIPDGFSFCQNCGTKVETDISEENKVAVANNTSSNIDIAKIKDSVVSVGSSVLVVVKKGLLSLKKVKVPRFVIPVVAVVLVVAILIGVVTNVVKALTPNDYVFYYVDGNVMAYNFKDDSVRMLSDSNSFYYSSDGTNYNARRTYILSQVTKYSENKDRIFYPGNYDSNSNSYYLYARYIKNEKQSSIKIDSDVLSYDITSDGKKVIYLKDSNSTLYMNTVEKDKVGERQKIASEVSEYYYSADFSKLLWKTTDNIFYMKDGNKEREKIVSDVETAYVLDNLDMYYFQDDYSLDAYLYYKPWGKEKIKVDSDVYLYSYRVNDDGSLYYLKKNPDKIMMADFVDDDMYNSDALITEPEYPDYDDYLTSDDYYEAREKYYEDRDLYKEKEERDKLRERLKKDEYLYSTFSTLYYFDGSKSNQIAENVLYILTNDTKNNSVVYNICNYKDIKVKFSEIYNRSDYLQYISDKISANEKIFYSINNESGIEIESTSAKNFDFDGSGKLYYLDEYDDDNDKGTLKYINTKNKDSAATTYADDVYSYGFFENKKIYYTTEYDNERDCATLYIDGKEVDYDVNYVSILDDDVFYFTDWNEEKDYGTLKKYESNGNNTVIADNVNSFIKCGDKLVYLDDYSTTSAKGDLYYYKNKSKRILLAEGVDFIVDGESIY